MVHSHPHNGRLSRTKLPGVSCDAEEKTHHDSSSKADAAIETGCLQVPRIKPAEIVWRHFSQEILETFAGIQSEMVKEAAEVHLSGNGLVEPRRIRKRTRR